VTDAVIVCAFSEGVYREQYERLREELEGAGYSVQIQESREREERGLGVTPAEAWDVAVRILDFTEDHPLIPIIIAASAKYLKGRVRIGPRRGERRVQQIYDDRGRPWVKI
jgi:hypothetical protein